LAVFGGKAAALGFVKARFCAWCFSREAAAARPDLAGRWAMILRFQSETFGPDEASFF